jgi:hypothetical protein
MAWYFVKHRDNFTLTFIRTVSLFSDNTDLYSRRDWRRGGEFHGSSVVILLSFQLQKFPAS